MKSVVVFAVVLVVGVGFLRLGRHHSRPAVWTPQVGRLASLPGGSYAATSSAAFGEAATDAVRHDDVGMGRLVRSNRVVRMVGAARVRVIDGGFTTLTVRVLAAPRDRQLVGRRVWVDPSWVVAP